jgi:drug/metabolite transporter (DMT)-like permease
MLSLAFLLVLASASIHAIWNLAAKKAQGGSLYFWSFSFFEVIIYTPILLLWGIKLSWGAVAFAMGSGLIHLIYFLLLLRGYKLGDLSLVYPISRGLGPIVSVIGAIFLFQESPSANDLWGAVVISIGAMLLTGDPRQLKASNSLPALGFGVLVALSIGAYTLWDSYAVKILSFDTLSYLWVNGLVRFLVLSPYAFMHREELRKEWTQDWPKAAVVGAGSMGGYALFLWAATLAPVSYVSPLRTLSILIGVVLGVNLLKEPQKLRRIGSAAIIVLGVILLNI